MNTIVLTIVSDDDLREAILRHLVAAGFVALGAASMREGLVMAGRAGPALILLEQSLIVYPVDYLGRLGISITASRNASMAGFPPSCSITFSRARVMTNGRPIGRQPWLTTVSTAMGPPRLTPTTP